MRMVVPPEFIGFCQLKLGRHLVNRCHNNPHVSLYNVLIIRYLISDPINEPYGIGWTQSARRASSCALSFER